MEQYSLNAMKKLITKYVNELPAGKVLDVGSMDVQEGLHPTYRTFFSSAWEYVGLDILPGPNVDLVVEDPYDWNLINEFDLVISGQCLEHVEYPWLTMECIAVAMKRGALHFNIVPSVGPVHKFPLDTYRYNQDGMIALCKWSGLEVIETFNLGEPDWDSTVLVAKKPASWTMGDMKNV